MRPRKDFDLDMTKTPKPLVVSKDLVKELQRLAVLSSQDDDARKAAWQRYEKATHQALSSTSEFSVALYKFTLAHAETPQLIEAKLNELGIQYKSTSTYYNHISRLVFANLPDGGAKRERESFYAGLMEKAHKEGTSVADFEKLVANGVTNAAKKLGLRSRPKTTKKMLDNAREIASRFMNDKTVKLTGATLAEDVEEGSELQLLARYEKGAIVVYGVIPPHLSNTEAVLTKLIASTTKPEKHKYDVLREMLAVIKLVTKVSDEKAIASYRVKDGKCHFIVAGARGTAVLTASSDFDVFQRDITLTVFDWARMISTLVLLQKHISSVDASDTEIVVSVNPLAIPDIHNWLTEKKQVLALGKASGTTLLFELNFKKEHLEEPSRRWDTLGSVAADKMEHAFKFKPTKKYATIAFNDGSVKFGSLARVSDGYIHLSKSSYRQLKAACVKMKGMGSELRFEARKNQLRVSVSVDDAITSSLLVGTE